MSFCKRLKIDKNISYTYSESDRLGTGSYADVFRGIKSDNNLPVAVKVIYKAKAAENWHTEVLIHQDVCCNPNIVELLDNFQTANHFYIITELCEGGTLRDKLKAQPGSTLNEDMAVEYMSAIVDALCTIHSKGIMHRDIKPENIFFKNGKIKLGDFGSSTGAEISIECQGTPEYLAPEMMTPDETEYDKQVDIWSLGIVFHEMLYGEKPNNSDKEKQNFEESKVNTKPRKSLDECHVSKEAKDLLQKMLEVDPKKRITIERVKEHPLLNKQKEEGDDEYCILESKDFALEGNKESQSCLSKLKDDALKAYLEEMKQVDILDEWVVVDDDPVERMQ